MAVTDTPNSQVMLVPSADAGAGVISANVFIGLTVRWVAPSTTGHQAIVKDSDNATVLTMTCFAGGQDVETRIPSIRGLRVTTLQSGTLEIHYQDRKTLVTSQGQPVITGVNPLS